MGDELVGAVVGAIVERVEPYGVWMTHDGANVLVLITDVADEPVFDLQLRYERGQRLRVQIVHFVGAADGYRGMLRGVDQ